LLKKASTLVLKLLGYNMIFSEKFKNYVLQSENILEFADEIEYYSGLKLSDIELLSKILKLLNEAFEPINDRLREHSNIIDEILDSKEYLSSTIEMKGIKKHTEDEIDEIYNDQFNNLPVKRKNWPIRL